MTDKLLEMAEGKLTVEPKTPDLPELNHKRLNNWFTACVSLRFKEQDPEKLRALVEKHKIRLYMMESKYTRGGVIVNCVDKKHRVLGQKAVSFFFK